MRNSISSIFLFLFVLVVAYGFTLRNVPSGNLNFLTTDSLFISGEQLYQKNCSACHGIDRQGSAPVFPSLVLIGDRMSREQINEQLLSGKNAMPSFSHLSNVERIAITGYLFGESTEIELVTDITPANNGNRLFVANCVRCHKTTVDDPQPPDQQAWGMQPAILGGIATKHTVDGFKNILNAGPCYMPSFDFLNEKDKEDIYNYLNTMESNYKEDIDARQYSCRMRCR